MNVHEGLHATCYQCGAVNERLAGPEQPPTDGDCALCYQCAALGVFDGPMLRKPTDQERQRIMQDPEARAMIHSAQLLIEHSLRRERAEEER